MNLFRLFEKKYFKTRVLQITLYHKDKKVRWMQGMMKFALFKKSTKKERRDTILRETLDFFCRVLGRSNKRRAKADAGQFFKTATRSMLLEECCQNYLLIIKQIQVAWRRTISWRDTWREKFINAWEKEIMNVDTWEKHREQNLAVKKLPKDRFCVSKN